MKKKTYWASSIIAVSFAVLGFLLGYDVAYEPPSEPIVITKTIEVPVYDKQIRADLARIQVRLDALTPVERIVEVPVERIVEIPYKLSSNTTMSFEEAEAIIYLAGNSHRVMVQYPMLQNESTGDTIFNQSWLDLYSGVNEFMRWQQNRIRELENRIREKEGN